MAKLYKISAQGVSELVADDISTATSFVSRGVGLLKNSNLAKNQGLWIKPCRDIHTFFMRFTIDCIFVDTKLQVVQVKPSIKPFRIIGPFWKAHSAFELHDGIIAEKNIQVGDHLYVVN